MVDVWVATLSVWSWSIVPPMTCAVLVIVVPAGTTAMVERRTKLVVAPLASWLGLLQVTTCPTAPHVQPVPVATT